MRQLIRAVLLVAVLAASGVATAGGASAAAPKEGEILYEYCPGTPQCTVFRTRPDGSAKARVGEGRWPSWSPDGSRIVFASDRDGDFEIYLMDRDGANVTQLTHNSVEDWDPAWSPTGAAIAFTSAQNGEPEIFLMDFTGANQRNITNHPAFDEMAAWSPDGSRIAFARGFDIWVMDADGNNATALMSTPSLAEAAPDWSPNGREIAFCGQRPPTYDLEVYVIRPDGSHERNLTKSPGSWDCYPSWSPDGRALAYASDPSPDGDDTQVYVMKANGKKSMRLTDGPLAVNPDWGP